MSVKIALLGFGTVASGVPFLLKENGEKINQSAHSEIEVAKVLVKDEDEKNRLLAAGNNFNFVTNVDDILSDQDITIVMWNPFANLVFNQPLISFFTYLNLKILGYSYTDRVKTWPDIGTGCRYNNFHLILLAP